MKVVPCTIPSADCQNLLSIRGCAKYGGGADCAQKIRKYERSISRERTPPIRIPSERWAKKRHLSVGTFKIEHGSGLPRHVHFARLSTSQKVFGGGGGSVVWIACVLWALRDFRRSKRYLEGGRGPVRALL